ncbi:hypothetical protein ACLOJK_009495 [Asimina triloba]
MDDGLKQRIVLAGLDIVDCQNQIIEFGPCHLSHNLAIFENLEGGNYPYTQLFSQRLQKGEFHSKI